MKDIPGFPNYAITRDGRVWSKPKKGHKGKWLRACINSAGYPLVTLRRDKKSHNKHIHELVLGVFIGPCPVGMECRHLDDNKKNHDLKNLCWGTHSDNAKDMVKNGNCNVINLNKGVYGERHPSSKLKDRQRRTIIYEYLTGLFTQQKLAKLYSVNPRTIWLLVNGKTWPFVNAVLVRKGTK